MSTQTASRLDDEPSKALLIAARPAVHAALMGDTMHSLLTQISTAVIGAPALPSPRDAAGCSRMLLAAACLSHLQVVSAARDKAELRGENEIIHKETRYIIIIRVEMQTF